MRTEHAFHTAHTPTYLDQITAPAPALLDTFAMKAKRQIRYTGKAKPFEDVVLKTENESGLTLFYACSLLYRYPYFRSIQGTARVKSSDLREALTEIMAEGTDVFRREIASTGSRILAPDFHSRCVRHVIDFHDAPRWCVFSILGLAGPGVAQNIMAETGMISSIYLPSDEEAMRGNN